MPELARIGWRFAHRRPGLALLGGLAMAVSVALWSCSDDAAGPQHSVPGRFAVVPSFASPAAAIVEVARIRFLLIRDADSSVARDTVVTVGKESDSVDVSFTVPVLSPNEPFTLYLQLIDAAGDTVFRAGPTAVMPSTAGGPPPAVPVTLVYVGVGADAAGVEITTADTLTFFGEPVVLSGVARDSAGEPIPGTPIAWRSLDSSRASVPEADSGRVLGGTARGTARIVAELLTGPADTARVLVQPLPNQIVADQGDDQVGTVGSALAQPLVARVLAADNLGVRDLYVRFNVTAGGGALSVDSTKTDSTGRASVTWTLGASVGTQTVTAATARLPAGSALFVATAASAGAQCPFLVSGGGQTDTVGATLPAPIVFEARNSLGNPVAGEPIAFAASVGGGSVSPDTVVTDANGQAATTWTLGPTATLQNMLAVIPATGCQGGTTATATAGTAVALQFQAVPANVAAGGVIMPAVNAIFLDGFGNSTSFANTVQIAILDNPSGGTLSGTTALVPQFPTLVQWTDLSIDLVGTGYTLEATAAGLESDTTPPFNVVAGATTVSWINPAGGNWTDPANWSTGTVPGPADTVDLTLNGTYTVTLDQPDTVAALFLGGTSGTQTLTEPGGSILGVSDTANIGPNGFFAASQGFNALGGFVIEGTVEIAGNLAGASGVTFVAPGGTFRLSPALGGGTLFFIQRTLRVAGTLEWDRPVNLSLLSGAAIEVQGGGTVLWSANAGVQGPPAGAEHVQNAGTFQFSGISMFVDVPFVNAAGGILDLPSGTFQARGNFTHAAGALIQGSGTLDLSAATVLAFDGVVNPGTSPGLLTITGPYAPGASATLNIELAGTAAGSGYDRLVVNGAATPGGTLAVDTLGGFVPSPGDRFAVLTYTSRTGDFDAVTFPSLAGVTLDTMSTTGQSPDTLYVVAAAGAPPGIQWINAAGGTWSNGANWSTGTVPTATDTVFIGLDGSYTVTLDVPGAAAFLALGGATGTQTLTTGLNTLTVDSSMTVGPNGVLAVAGGTFASPTGFLLIGGVLDWSGGTISTGGGVAITSSGSSLWSVGAKTLASDVNNLGAITWSAGNLTVQNGAVVTNAPGATMDAQGDFLFTIGTGGGSFVNFGTFTKSGGTSAGTAFIAPATNDGTMDAQVGTIGFGNTGTFTHAGVFTTAVGGAFSFGGTGTHTLDSTVTGGGAFGNTNADLTLNGSVTIGHLSVGAFANITVNAPLAVADSIRVGRTLTLNGPGSATVPFVRMVDGSSGIDGTQNLFITDSLAWGGGAQRGSGTTTILASAVLRLAATGQAVLDGRSLVNQGTVIWSAGDFSLNNGGTFNNGIGATVDLQGDFALNVVGTGTFSNGGTFMKSAGAGVTPVAVSFDNTGTLDVQSGTLDMNDVFTLAAGSVLRGTGVLDLSDAVAGALNGILSPGTSPGTLTVLGNITLGSQAIFNVEVNGTSPSQYDRLDVGGTLAAAGMLNVGTGFSPVPGDSFTVLTFASRTGGFPSTAGLDLGNGLTLDTVWLPTELALVARTTPQLVLFAGDSAGGLSSGIFSVNPNGTGQLQLATEGPPLELNVHPRWSPDRTELTYTARIPGDANQLHIRSADGLNVFHLTSAGDTSTFSPRYSPDGVHLAFQCGNGGFPGTAQDVCVIADVTNPVDGMGDGGGKLFVTDAIDASLGGSGGFAWNPQNPGQLAVVRDSVLGGPIGSTIWLVNFDGSGRTALGGKVVLDDLGSPVQIYSMDWSPDGSFIAFDGTSASGRSIFRIEVATGAVTQLTTGNQDHRPVIAPDNTDIIFGREIDIWELRIVPAVGGNDNPMTPLMNFDLDQAGWDWSPDGSEIVLTEDFTTSSVVISKILRTTTPTSFNTDAKRVGRRGISAEVQDRQPSWRP